MAAKSGLQYISLSVWLFEQKKKEFLSNHDSKHRFTAMLSRSLEQTQQSGCEVHQAKADANILIVQTADICI